MSKIQLAVGVHQGQVPVLPPPVISGRAPTSNDVNFTPGQLWFDKPNGELYVNEGAGIWNAAGEEPATTTTEGVVQLGTLSELQNGNAPAGPIVPLTNDVATVIQAIVVGAVPPATESQQGIAEIATQAETDTGTDDTRIVTPLKLATYVAGGGGAGSFTDLTATGAVSFTGATGGLTMTSATASSLGVTGAGIDLTLDSDAGQLILTGGEAAINAVRIQADDSAGGIDVDAGTGGITVDTTGALSIDSAGTTNLTTTGAFDLTVQSTAGSVIVSASEDAVDAIQILSTAGGMAITATGEAGQDISIQNNGGSVNVGSTENAALSIYLHANGGTSETIQVRADQGTGATSIELLSDVGGVALNGGSAAATAVSLTSSNVGGGITMTAGTAGILPSTTGPMTLTSTYNNASNTYIHANGGTSETIKIHADQGTAATSLNLLSDVGGITLTAGLASADAINIVASDVAGGIDIDSGTNGFDVLTTGAISLDSAADSNLSVTGAFAMVVESTAGQLLLTSGEAAADSIRILSSDVAGGLDVDAGTGGITIDTTGALSIDSAGTTNLTATGAFDITVQSTAGSLNLLSGEAAVDAIAITAGDAAGGIDINAGTGGITVDTTAAISLDSATASNFTVTGTADLTLASSAGAVNVTSGEANADSINVTSGGGMNIVATGAAAKDIILTCTNGSMTLTAGENVTDAIVINASGAASALQLDAGTGSIRFGSGLVVPSTAVDNAASPYSVLGTDYLLAVDTSGGAVTVTLPAATALAGRSFVIRDVGGAAAVNNITIGGGGTNLVGGGAAAASKTLSAAYSGATVYSDGTVWSYAYVA